MMGKPKLENVVIYAIIGFGFFFAIGQFIYNRSLWLDEAMLALNIVNRSFGGLLHPLDYYQVAPILFLQLEKLFSISISNSELGLRIFPLLAFILSVFFFYKIITTIHSNQYTIILCLSLLVFNSPMIYYASEVKQYMVDVLVVTSIYYILLRADADSKQRLIQLAIVGTFAIWLSNVTPIILFTVGIYLLYTHLFVEKNRIGYLAFVFAAWVASFSFYYYYFIYHHPSAGAMVSYWSNLDAFAARNPFSKAYYFYLLDRWTMFSRHLFQFGETGSEFIFILLLTGFLSLVIRRKIGFIILTVLPIGLHLFLSSFRLYPFDVRLILYMCPMFILLFSFGFTEIVDLVFADFRMERFRLLALAIPLWLGYMLYSDGFYGSRLPFKREEVKKCMNYVAKNILAGDKAYVYPASVYAFGYYRNIGVIEIDNESIHYGADYVNYDQYVEEIEKLNGRYWLIFSHAGQDEKYIISKLDLLGYQKLDEYKDVGSNVYLYNLTK